MSLCDCRGHFANGKEMARRRSISREPQAMLACESLIQRRAASRDIDAAIHKMHRHKQRAASLLASESLIQSKRADELICASLISLQNVFAKIYGGAASVSASVFLFDRLHFKHTAPGKLEIIFKRCVSHNRFRCFDNAFFNGFFRNFLLFRRKA